MNKLNRFTTWLRKKVPERRELFKSRWLKPFEHYFAQPYYWSLRRKNVALSVAVGMFCGLMPGPTQILTAFIIAYLLRINLPIAVLTTLYSNPITYLPLYFVAYKIGVFILGGDALNHPMSLATLLHLQWSEIGKWLSGSIGYLSVGVPILGLTLSFLAYYLVLFLARLRIIARTKLHWEDRKKGDY